MAWVVAWAAEVPNMVCLHMARLRAGPVAIPWEPKHQGARRVLNMAKECRARPEDRA